MYSNHFPHSIEILMDERKTIRVFKCVTIGLRFAFFRYYRRSFSFGLLSLLFLSLPSFSSFLHFFLSFLSVCVPFHVMFPDKIGILLIWCFARYKAAIKGGGAFYNCKRQLREVLDSGTIARTL